MKENKKFFYNNTLNKGYTKTKQDYIDVNLMRRKQGHGMPPLELLQEYEEQYPGTFNRLFNMAEKEQKHRHATNLLRIESATRAVSIGKKFGMILVLSVVIGAIVLLLVNAYLVAIGVVFTLFILVLIINRLASANPKIEETGGCAEIKTPQKRYPLPSAGTVSSAVGSTSGAYNSYAKKSSLNSYSRNRKRKQQSQ